MRTAERLATLQGWVRARRPWLFDALLATLFVLIGLLTTGAGDATDPDGLHKQRDTVALGLILAATLPYYVLHRAPVGVYVVTATAVTVLMLSGYREGALPFVLLAGAYTVGAYRPARKVVAATTLMTLLLAVIFVADIPGFGVGELVSSGGAYVTATLLGRAAQSRQQRLDAVERQRVEAASRAAADERLRIAQELHDIVAHSLGVIAVPAGVGMHVIDTDPVEARRSFESISHTSRASLSEIRRLLGVVRSTEAGPTYTPAPGLADLPRLIEEVGGAGLSVDMSVDGETGDVPRSVGLAAFRIVQESLTNALRHSGARRATVRLESEPGLLVVEVTDDGRGPNGTRPRGHGIVGMRERVAVYGGSLETGSGTGGGFRVAARLPYDEEPVA